jgi:hypothetical protein
VVQTAWALLGLMAAGCTDKAALRRGVEFLRARQLPSGGIDFPLLAHSLTRSRLPESMTVMLFRLATRGDYRCIQPCLRHHIYCLPQRISDLGPWAIWQAARTNPVAVGNSTQKFASCTVK